MKRITRSFLLALFIVAAAFSSAHATSSIGKTFVSTYPSAAQLNVSDCTLCHLADSNSLNDYGSDLAGANKNFSAINDYDSDGDGFNNLAEILALTFPGDDQSYPDTPPTPPNNPPVANAGPDQTAFVGVTVTLNGSESSDKDGNPLTYSWSIIEQPATSSATLFNPAAVFPTFDVDVPGTYVVQLIVDDGIMDSTADTVTITTENSAPVANAGPDQKVFVYGTVTLDGSRSSDVDGDSLTYKWSLTKPAASIATLSVLDPVFPTFVPDVPGTYVVQLIVNDGKVDSPPDTVTITTTENSAPVANAGPDQTVFVGVTVSLTGSGSSDVDGDTLSFSWSFTSTPDGSSAMLSNADTVSPTFYMDVPGTYVVQLIVDDGTVDSAPDTVTITTENSAPVADAGRRQRARLGDTVTLDGSGSSDADNNPLTYKWSLTKPAASIATLSVLDPVFPTFVPDVPGTYVVQLIVNDGKVDSAPGNSVVRVGKGGKPATGGGKGGKGNAK